jgi:transposase-like protein
MPKHKSEDYKLSAVQYYLENDVSYVKTCEIFKCSESIIDYQYPIKLRKNM